MRLLHLLLLLCSLFLSGHRILSMEMMPVPQFAKAPEGTTSPPPLSRNRESQDPQPIVLRLRQAQEISLALGVRVNDFIINAGAYLLTSCEEGTDELDGVSSDNQALTSIDEIDFMTHIVQEYQKIFPMQENILDLTKVQMAENFLRHLLRETVQNQEGQKLKLLQLSSRLILVERALKRRMLFLTLIAMWKALKWRLERRPFTYFNCVDFGVTLLSNVKDYSKLAWYDITLLPLEWYQVKILERVCALKIAKIEADLQFIRGFQGEFPAMQLKALFEKYA